MTHPPEWHLVTDDPELHARLLEKEAETGTVQLVEYVHSLGMFPPGYPDVDPGISVRWGPDDQDDADGTLVWDIEPRPQEDGD